MISPTFAAAKGVLFREPLKPKAPLEAAITVLPFESQSVRMVMKEAEVIIRGVGAGRESALRSFSGKGIGVSKITDMTPVPHNGPRPPKARRI